MARRRIQRVDGTTAEMPTEGEMLHRRMTIRGLHALGLPRAQIIQVACEQLSIKPTAAAYVLDGIRNDLRVEAELAAPQNHAAALERAYTDLGNARLDLASLRNQAVKDWRAINATRLAVDRIEQRIADLEGTTKPVKVDVAVVGVNEALQRALVGMTQDQIDAAVAEERERLRDAAAIPTTASVPRDPPSSTPKALPLPKLQRGAGPNRSAPAARASDRVGRPQQAPGGAEQQARPADSPGPDANVDRRPAPRGIGARVVS